MTIQERIDTFLAADSFAVAGASTNKNKYGNKVLRCYLQNQRSVVPVNPNEESIEGIVCVADVNDLPDHVESLSIITPPHVTEAVVEAAANKGIPNVWMQPGAESEQAVKACEAAGINVIADGSCLLVVLGYRDH